MIKIHIYDKQFLINNDNNIKLIIQHNLIFKIFNLSFYLYILYFNQEFLR